MQEEGHQKQAMQDRATQSQAIKMTRERTRSVFMLAFSSWPFMGKKGGGGGVMKEKGRGGERGGGRSGRPCRATQTG